MWCGCHLADCHKISRLLDKIFEEIPRPFSPLKIHQIVSLLIIIGNETI
jgi:hypothetical protein